MEISYAIRKQNSLNCSLTQGGHYNANLSPTLQITFNKKIPKKIKLQIEAQSFGPNGDKDTIIKIEKIKKKIKITNDVKVYDIVIDTSGTSNMIEIIPPNPLSPLSLGVSGDSRKLGIKVKNISLEEVQ